jgi:alpha-L-rhamnosidase
VRLDPSDNSNCSRFGCAELESAQLARSYLLPALFCACSLRAAEQHAVEGGLQDLENALENPPPDSRLMVRWWWFGASVTKPEIEREIRAMQQGGIGGFEVQPVYPMTLDDPSQGISNLPYLSSGFLDTWHFASEKAHELGVRMDVTLGSGWPFGGPYVPVTHAAGMLRIVKTLVPMGANAIPVPSMTVGEKLLAAFISQGDPQHLQLSGTTPLSIEHIREGRLSVQSGLSGQCTVLFFIESRTGMMVKRPAVGAEGFVLDHFDREATMNHLQNVGDRLMTALADRPPYAVFSDSLEVYGSDWTSKFSTTVSSTSRL